VRTIRAVIPQMRVQGSGCIVCISGKGGRAPRDVHLPGCSANAALNLLVRGLAGTYGRDGVRILAVSPGVIASPRLTAIQVAALGNDLDSAAAQMRHSNALGRLGTAAEVSAAVLFAVSNTAGFVNGGVLEVDGG
jgi:3-oxoacyl-[acyl-carrier protein] reductase